MTQDIRTIRIATQGPAGPAGPSGSANVYDAASQAEMLALAAHKGDVAIRSDLSANFVLAAADPSVLANWKELLTPASAVVSVAGLAGAIGATALKTALAIAAADVSGLAASATSDTTNAGNISSGTLSNARLSGVALTANNLSDLANAGTARTNLGLGALATLGVGSGLASGGGNLSASVTSVAGRTGAVTLSSSDVSGLAASATTDATNAGNIASGALADARLSSNVPLKNAANVFTAVQTATGYAASSGAIIGDSSTARTLSSGDNGKVLVFTNASAVTVTVPSGLGAGFSCMAIQNGAGQVGFSVSSTTMSSYGSLTHTAGQYAAASLIATAADVFTLAGALA